MQTLDALTEIARQAGERIQQVRREGLTIASKLGGEVVTSADRASHEIMMAGFGRHFPDLPRVTEESAEHHIPRPPFLVADELDGTAPFSHGLGDWGVMLALVDEAGPSHGVMVLPDRGVLVRAARGQGCVINGQPVALGPGDDPAATLVAMDLNRQLQPAQWQRLQKLAAACQGVRSHYCAAVSTYELLAGHLGLYVNCIGGRIWDFAVPALAVREAGGCVAAPAGGGLVWDRVPMGLVATADESLMALWRGL
ncbi:MAG: inositol monophosphatase family protein [Pseudomonadota bacterium]|nr:inositol monophosphatase family protein [Pseudomonadota bacterium]